MEFPFQKLKPVQVRAVTKIFDWEMFIAGHSGWSESGMPESYNIYFVLRNEHYLYIITVWDSGICKN